MKLSAPKQATFVISVLLLIVAVVAKVANITMVAPHAFWFAVASQVVLMIGCAIKGF